MNIEITEEMKKEIIKVAAQKLYDSMYFNISDLRAEIISETSKKIVDNISSAVAGEFHKKVNVENLVDKAIVGFEDRVNKRIEKTLAKGIRVKLVD